MRRVLALALLALLAASLALPLQHCSCAGESEERAEIYVAGSCIMWRLVSTKPPVTIDSVDWGLAEEAGVREVILSFSVVRRWPRIYSYMLEGVVFDGTGIGVVEKDAARLEIVFEEWVDEGVARAIAYNLSRAFHLRFTPAYTSGPSAVFYAPLNSTYHKTYILRGLSWNYTGIFSSASFEDTMTRADYARIVVRARVGGGVSYSLEFSSIKHYSFPPGEYDFRLSIALPYISQARAGDDVDRTVVRVAIADALLLSIPPNMSVTLDGHTYVLERVYGPGEQLKDAHIRLMFAFPLLMVSKSVSANTTLAGGNITVRVRVSNLGGGEARDILVEEPEWWAGLGNVTGQISRRIALLRPGETEEMVYVVTLARNASYIAIPPTRAIVNASGLAVEFRSSAVNVHAVNGSVVSVVSASVSELSPTTPAAGDRITYYLEVWNNGTRPIRELSVDGVFVRELRPGSVKLPMEREASSLRPSEIVISHSLEYSIGGERYSLEGPYVPVMYRLTRPLLPRVDVGVRVEGRGCEYNVTVAILANMTGEGTIAVRGIVLGNTSYVAGDFEEENRTLAYVYRGTQPGGNLTLSMSISLENGTSSLPPLITASVRDRRGSMSMLVCPRPILADVRVDVARLPDVLLKGLTYALNVTIWNGDYLPLHNVTVTVSTSGITVRNATALSVAELAGRSEMRVVFNATPTRTGSVSISSVAARFVYCGFQLSASAGGYSAAAIKGVAVRLSVPRSVVEGSEIPIEVVVARDSPEVTDIAVKWALPRPLTFTGGASLVEVPIEIADSKGSVRLVISPPEPGRYSLEPPEVTFVFRGKRYSIRDLGVALPRVEFEVRENVVMRYWTYFGAMLALAAVLIGYVRRRVGA